MVDTPLSLAVRRASRGDDPSDCAGWQVPAHKMRRGSRAGIRPGKGSGFDSGSASRRDTISTPGHLRPRVTTRSGMRGLAGTEQRTILAIAIGSVTRPRQPYRPIGKRGPSEHGAVIRHISSHHNAVMALLVERRPHRNQLRYCRASWCGRGRSPGLSPTRPPSGSLRAPVRRYRPPRRHRTRGS